MRLFNKKSMKPKKQEEQINFIKSKKLEKVSLKSALMEFEALNRGLEVQRLSRRVILVKSKSGLNLGFVHMNGIRSSSLGTILCDRKQDSRKIFKNKGISVAESKVFKFKNLKEATQYVKKIGFPVVVKPASLSRGRGITTNITNLNDFNTAWKGAYNAYSTNRKTKSLIVEKHIKGDDYRFFIVGDKLVSASFRKRANVLGDGKSTVLELIKMKNRERKKNPYLSSFLIPEDLQELDMLIAEGINLDFIPDTGVEVVLRSQSNLSAGGDSIDVTDRIHPEFGKIAIKAVKAIPGIDYAGVDFITSDITAKPTKSNYVVGEVEFSPAPFTHFPFKGKPRDMAGAIMDYYLTKSVHKI